MEEKKIEIEKNVYKYYNQPSSKMKAIINEVIRIKKLKEKCILYT